MTNAQSHFGEQRMRVELKPRCANRLNQVFVMLKASDVKYVVGELSSDRFNQNTLILSDDSSVRRNHGVDSLDVHPLNAEQFEFFDPEQFEILNDQHEPVTAEEMDAYFMEMSSNKPSCQALIKKPRDQKLALG